MHIIFIGGFYMNKVEWKFRLFVGVLSFLLGMTLGWVSGGTGLSKWWIFSVDIIFISMIGFLIGKILLSETVGKFQRKSKD